MSKRFSDRKDGKLLTDIDPMHFICPIIYPNRCDNEAFISEVIDLSRMQEYLDRKNAGEPAYKYNLFQTIVTAMLKTVTLRPKMNRFIANSNMYMRNEISASFVVKKQFSDEGGEALAFIHAKETFNIDDVHEAIYQQISSCRSDKLDSSTESMDTFQRMPRFLSKALVKFMRFMDRFGLVPASLIETDPYYSTVVLTNLGSIKLHSGYHHLTNWGTNSVFVTIGERKLRPFFQPDGTFEMRDSVDIGLTIDERLADGYYYSKTVRLLKKLLEEPELLETPFSQEIDY